MRRRAMMGYPCGRLELLAEAGGLQFVGPKESDRLSTGALIHAHWKIIRARATFK